MGPLNGKQRAGQQKLMTPLPCAIYRGYGIAEPGSAKNNSNSREAISQQEDKGKKGKDITGRRSEKRRHMTFNFSSSGIDYNFQIIREELGSV